MKIYIIDEERFENADCYGFTPLEYLKYKFPSAESVKSEKAVKKTADAVAVLYADTPLADTELLEALLRDGGEFAIGNGYISRTGSKDNLKQTDDIRAMQVKTLSDFTAVFTELKKLSAKRFTGRNILFYDIESCYIDFKVEIADGAVIYPNVALRGKTKIGENTKVFSFCDLTDTVIGANSDIRSTFSTGVLIGSGTTVGPFATLRKGAIIGDNCRVGDYVEVKNATLGDSVKAAHLAYIGDASVGQNTNIGCGTVFANYNGRIKQKTVVGENVFIGANSNLVAPLTVEEGVYIAAGSTVTSDIPSGALCIARSRQVIKHNYVRK